MKIGIRRDFPGMSRPFDARTTIMIIIGGGILSAMFLLIGVVLCLYSKVAKALNSSGTEKEADAVSCVAPCSPCKVTLGKIIQAKPIAAAEACHVPQCYDACSVYSDVGSLPPCFCNVTEGL